MKLLAEEIEDYSAMFSTPETAVLAELNRETHLHIMVPQMLSGHIQGNFLKMMSFMLRPKRVLEIGTFTGYSAICFASGLAENGLVHTIDINAELEDICTKYFKKSGFEGPKMSVPKRNFFIKKATVAAINMATTDFIKCHLKSSR
mgnify:CR=1 FL=1